MRNTPIDIAIRLLYLLASCLIKIKIWTVARIRVEDAAQSLDQFTAFLHVLRIIDYSCAQFTSAAVCGIQYPNTTAVWPAEGDIRIRILACAKEHEFQLIPIGVEPFRT